MGLSNTATPIYYGRFRDSVLAGEIPVNREISQEMNRIDALIANPNMFTMIKQLKDLFVTVKVR
jgi:hypothetical protein